MSDLKQVDAKFDNKGINVRDVPDALAPGEWRRLTNVRSFAEGSLTTRPGRRFVAGVQTGFDVHTLTKLDDVIVSASGTRVYHNGEAFPTIFSGAPLSWAKHRASDGDEKWLYVTDGTQFRMLGRDGSDIKWGITAPTEKALGNVYAVTGNLDSSVAGAIVYDWRVVYKNTRTGGKSNPSPVNDGIAVVGQQAKVTTKSSVDGQVDTVEFYRRGGSILDTWRFVGTAPNGGADPITGTPLPVEFVDNISDAVAVQGFALALDNDVPFTSEDIAGNAVKEAPLPYVWGPFNGQYLFSCGDPNRPGEVYWTNPGKPHSADPANHTAVTGPDEPLIGGFVHGDVPYVWSRSNLWALDFQGVDALPTFKPRKTFCGRGLSLPFAFAVGPLIWFFSKDGIYATDGQSPAEPYTETNLRPLFDPQVENRTYVAPGALGVIDWPAFDIAAPATGAAVNAILRMAYGGQELHVHYKDALGQWVHLRNQLPYNRWCNDESPEVPGGVGSVYETLSFFDDEQPNTTLLIGTNTGLVALETDVDDYVAGTKIQCRVREGSDTQGLPQTFKEYVNVILDIDCGDAVLPLAVDPLQPSGIAFVPYLNNETTILDHQRLTTVGRQKVPRAFTTSNDGEPVFAYSFAGDWEWNGRATLFGKTLQFQPDEESITSWVFGPTSHGMRGWQHVRDVYLSIASGTPTIGASGIAATVFIDGTEYPLRTNTGATSFEIPAATAEKKLKVHLWGPPVKGKEFRYKIVGTQFRLYPQACEVRAKEFASGLSYQIVNPFQGGTSEA